MNDRDTTDQKSISCHANHRNTECSSHRRQRCVTFNRTTRIYDNANDYVEPAELWYSRTETRSFLAQSQTEATVVAQKHRALRRAYVLYSQGLDVSNNGNNTAAAATVPTKAEESVGLHRLAIHAHLRSRRNAQHQRLLKRLMELQSVQDPDRRQRLQAQASCTVSQAASLAATHLAQWQWKRNQATIASQ